jgi:hypothetical protein
MSAPKSRQSIWGGEIASNYVSFPPRLLDELARLFACAALDRFIQESALRRRRHSDDDHTSNRPESEFDSCHIADRDVDDDNVGG